MAKYSELKAQVLDTEKKLFFLGQQVIDAHKMLDDLDAPKSASGAFVGHRWHWYSEGKRESHKTKDNAEGYPPDEWAKKKELPK